MNSRAQQLISHYKMKPHPEGGYFAEAYKSNEVIKRGNLPHRFGGDRVFMTSIYFLFAGNSVSKLHRLKSDELWHFYEGSAIHIHVFKPNGEHSVHQLGIDITNGESSQVVIPWGCWFGSLLTDPSSYAFVGCALSPGFEIEDFEFANREQMLAQYPKYKAIIERFF